MRGPQPASCAGPHVAYIVWSLVPVLIAIQFSFNAGRSRSDLAGLLVPLVLGRPDASVWHDESLRMALTNSLTARRATMLIATPIGVALAIGLARWRGRLADRLNRLMLSRW